MVSGVLHAACFAADFDVVTDGVVDCLIGALRLADLFGCYVFNEFCCGIFGLYTFVWASLLTCLLTKFDLGFAELWFRLF